MQRSMLTQIEKNASNHGLINMRLQLCLKVNLTPFMSMKEFMNAHVVSGFPSSFLRGKQRCFDARGVSHICY